MAVCTLSRGPSHPTLGDTTMPNPTLYTLEALKAILVNPDAAALTVWALFMGFLVHVASPFT